MMTELTYEPAIDMHTHYHGGGIIDALRRRTSPPYIGKDEETGQEFMVKAATRFPYTDMDDNLETRLAYMDKIGLRMQTLSFAGNIGIDAVPAEEAIPVVAQYNDHAADVRRHHPDRFVTIAGLPFADIHAAAQELRRARLELGHLGALIPAGYVADLEQLERLRPLFEVADDVGAYLIVHPGPRTDQIAYESPYPDFRIHRISVLDLLNSASHAVITLALSDFLDDYKNVTMHVINLGGTIPFVFERMEHVLKVRTPDAPSSLRDRMRRLYVDNSSLGPNALELAVKVFGADRVMLGTDYPYFPDDYAQHSVSQANLTDEQRTLIRSGNAERIINLYS